MSWQPNGLYEPILKMIFEKTGDPGIAGFFGYVGDGGGGSSGPGNGGVPEHTHVFSELDFRLTHPQVFIYNEDDDVIGIDIGESQELQFRFIKDVYDDYTQIKVTFLFTTTYTVGIFYQRYNPSVGGLVEDKGNIIKLDLI
jgi:hypothetical protein